MKTKIAYKFLPFVLLMLVMGCSKKEDAAPVDPRDQYVGVYALNANQTLKNRSTGETQTGSDSGLPLTVQKGTNSDELTFTDMVTYPVKLTGSNFVIPTYSQNVTINGASTTLTFTASGSFNGKSMSYTEIGVNSTYTLTNTISGSKP